MKTILTIGPHRFVLQSLSVANAIVAALQESPQVEVTAGKDSACYVPAPEARRIDTFAAHLANEDQVRVANLKPLPPIATALLDVPTREARETRRTLAAAGPVKRSRHDLANR